MRRLRGAAKGTKPRTKAENTILTKKKSVDMVNPQIFRIGDIVEAQISFIAAPVKNNKYKFIVVLRSIALLDPTFSQVGMVINACHYYSRAL